MTSNDFTPEDLKIFINKKRAIKKEKMEWIDRIVKKSLELIKKDGEFVRRWKYSNKTKRCQIQIPL